jgi:hypothetical protein
MMLDVRFGPRAGERRAPVVERALALQPRHRGVDIVLLELPAGEAQAHLRFRQLAPREHPQPRHVGAVAAIRHAVSVSEVI